MGDAAEQAKGEVPEEQKPKSKMPFIIIGFVVLLGAVVFFWMNMLKGSDADNPLPQKFEEVGYMYSFEEPFTVNLAPPDSENILTCSITIEIKQRKEFSEREALEEIGIETESKKTKKSMILDIINEILKTKTRNDIKSTEGREKIRVEIQQELNNFVLQKADIKGVYITQWVVS